MRHILSSLLLLCLPMLPIAAQQPVETYADIRQGLKQADSLIDAQQYATALDLLAPLERATEHPVTPEDSVIQTRIRQNICLAYAKSGKYEEACTRCKAYRGEAIPGSTIHQSWNAYYVRIFRNYCFALSQSKHASLSVLLDRLDSLRREVGPDYDSIIVHSMGLLSYREAILAYANCDYPASYRLFSQAAEYYRQSNNIDEELKCIKQLATAERHRWNAEKAEQYLKDIYTRARKSGNKLILLDILEEMTNHYHHNEDRENTWRCCLEADSMAQGEDNPEFLIPYYLFKGNSASLFGNYLEAEKWYEQAVPYFDLPDIQAAKVYKNSTYITLSTICQKNGKWDEAAEYARLSYEHSLIPNYEKQAYFERLANIYGASRDSLRAIAAIDSLINTLPLNNDQKRYDALLVISDTYKNIGNYQAALRIFEQIDTLQAQKKPGEWALRGLTEARLGKHAESVAHYNTYLDFLQQNTYKRELNISLGQIALGEVYLWADSIEQATAYVNQGIDNLKRIVREELPYYSSSERDNFWKNVLPQFIKMTPFALKAELLHTDFTRHCYDALVLSKSFLLESDRTLSELVGRDGTPDDNRDLAEIMALQSQLNALRVKPNTPGDSILALSDRLIHLDRQLKANCKAYGDLFSFMEIDFNQVRTALRPDEVLIDFTDYLSQTNDQCYAAYLVRPDDDLPRLFPLFRKSQIDSMHVPYSHLYCEAPYSRELIDLLWKPLARQVPVGATVYYAPTQWLYEIAPENLQLDDGSLLGDHYRFVRISSARELVRRAATTAPAAPAAAVPLLADGGEAVLYGGLQYDLSVEDMLSQAQNYRISPYLAMRGNAGGDEAFPPLPETRVEVDSITALLREGGIQATSFSGVRGTEESFLSLSGHAPRLLHLATHGFYYTPEEAQRVDFLRGQTDAMSLSGLVMAGGNAAWRGVELPGGVLGGILTAASIARMDLSGVEMVVLSACQTGLGQATSEGLYGLQRAFKKAGVQTLVMTLWEVSDVIARQFMVRFYENLAGRHGHFADKRAAFDAAKAYIRSRYSEAYAWAAFVMLD